MTGPAATGRGAEPTGADLPGAGAGSATAVAAFQLRYLAVGVYLGVVLTKSEAVSWYRIQEMFRFDSFHMYGLLLTAMAVAAGSVLLIERYRVRSLGGEPITIAQKEPRWRSALLGGSVFGLGWALAGACPGPIAALIGAGMWGYALVLVGGMAGTLLYGRLRGVLPH